MKEEGGKGGIGKGVKGGEEGREEGSKKGKKGEKKGEKKGRRRGEVFVGVKSFLAGPPFFSATCERQGGAADATPVSSLQALLREED